MSESEKNKEQSGKKACGGCCRQGGEPRGKLHCTNWLADIPGGCADSEFVEVQFKNTRKGYYKNHWKSATWLWSTPSPARTWAW